MASGRAPIVVGVLAITAGIAWFALRGTSDAPAPSPGSQGSGTLTPTGKAAISAPSAPALAGSGSAVANAFDSPRPALPEVPEKPSHRDLFAAQPRDNDWSDQTEDDLKDRVRALKVTTVSAIDCRTNQCELTLAGTATTVEANMAKLESGLTTTANALLLGRPERSGDQLTIRVYAMYER